jgi:hypothetical protein
MPWLVDWRAKRANSRLSSQIKAKRIESLRAELRSVLQRELEAATSMDDEHDAFRRATEKQSALDKSIRYLEQDEANNTLIQLGIEVPDPYVEEDLGHVRLLTQRGFYWAKQQIRNSKRSEIEAWGRTLSPFFTFLVSLLSAFISLGSLLVAWAALHNK